MRNTSETSNLRGRGTPADRNNTPGKVNGTEKIYCMTYIRRTQKYQLLAKMYSTPLVVLMHAIKTAKTFAKIKHRSDSRSFLTTEKTLLGLAAVPASNKHARFQNHHLKVYGFALNYEQYASFKQG